MRCIGQLKVSFPYHFIFISLFIIVGTQLSYAQQKTIYWSKIDKTTTKDVTIGKNNHKVNIGDVMLAEDTESLDEVTVVAEISTIQQKVDRKVINVGNDLTTSGPTANDIMNNLPSVNVDQQTGNISLRN